MSLPPESSEQRSEMLDPHRREERTSDPQNPEFVIPARNADETIEGYIRRVNNAASNLE